FALTTKYVSSDYDKDGEENILQTHAGDKGIGIPLVITCDGFSDDMYEKFNTEAVNAMNYFFSIAPYKDFRDYFDVYSLMAVSPNNEVGLNLAYGTTYSGDSYSIVTDKVRMRLNDMELLDSGKYPYGQNVLTIVLLNETRPEPNRAVCFFSTDGFAAAIAPVDEDMENIIHHEAGGHGFAFLGDEYYDDGSTETFTNNVSRDGSGNPIDIDAMHSRGIYWNVDYKNTSSTANWKDFWADAAYASENIGAYAGGMGSYVDGIYHSTPKSTMLNQREFDKFNPISRWAIYRQIVLRAGYAEPTIDLFKEYDKVANISYTPPAVSVVTRNYVETKKFKLGAPPVIEWK
ncbi:MAG: M64 family metallopeptidase, partial [Bacteroidaceae bacterium]|nr:M64 family metallopeptidase [Bacteroidaceae bacterium]